MSENKAAYLAGASGVVIGGVAVYLVTINRGSTNISTEIHGNENIVTNIVVNLQRRMHPGYKIQCRETGEVFASINRTAEVMGLSPKLISKNLKGVIPNVDGHTFVNLGEMS